MAQISKEEAVEIIKNAVGDKIDDKRTKIHRAWEVLRAHLLQDDKALLEWVEKEMEEYEFRKNGGKTD